MLYNIMTGPAPNLLIDSYDSYTQMFCSLFCECQPLASVLSLFGEVCYTLVQLSELHGDLHNCILYPEPGNPEIYRISGLLNETFFPPTILVYMGTVFTKVCISLTFYLLMTHHSVLWSSAPCCDCLNIL